MGQPEPSTTSDPPSPASPSSPQPPREGEPKPSTNSDPPSPASSLPRQSLPRLTVSLVQPSQKKKKSVKVFRVLRSVFRSFPIFTPVCKFNGGFPDNKNRTVAGVLITGTLFGFRRGRVSLCIQQNPRCLPSVVVELPMQTSVLQKEMSLGMVRIALECEKRPSVDHKEKLKLLEEPMWSMYCNGKKSGYGYKRDATEDDLNVMELLKAVSMGAGVLPGNSDAEGPDGEMAYMRADFEHVVGSKDSETLYLISPGGSNGPELSIFFVRV
ncbi:Protein of unknown function DUF617 [Macleaya cordata]|uniref:Protein MIZU-KUSSEI 1 n=1 Tax=Macleaya cordata TaxID=56857 RepID=A0A200R2U8_MACCD|nr:Protein of unknown function DUF617 [Macleaya cordata]